MQASQLAYDYIMSIFSNVGRNGVEYYRWGYRVYIDGPTCEAMIKWGRGGTAVTAAVGYFGGFPRLTIGAIITNIFLAEMDILNQGRGIYFDVHYLPVFARTEIFWSMRPQ